MWIERHWRGTAGVLLTIFGLARWVLDVIGDVDTAIAHVTTKQGTWLGHVFDWMFTVPAGATPVIALAGLSLIWWENHQKRTAIAPPSYEQLEDADLKKRASKWLATKLSEQGLGVQRVALFGSIVHKHFKTSDVDVIVRFHPATDSQIAKAVRYIKATIAKEFKQTFDHDLHVKFFCADEKPGYEVFVSETKHEEII